MLILQKQGDIDKKCGIFYAIHIVNKERHFGAFYANELYRGIIL